MCNPTQSGEAEAEGIFISREAVRYIYLEGGSTVYLPHLRRLGSSVAVAWEPLPLLIRAHDRVPRPALPLYLACTTSSSFKGMDGNTKARGTEIVPDDLSEPPPSSKPLSLVADSCFVDLSPCRFGLVQQEIYYILLTKTKTKTVIQTKGSHPSP